MIRTCYPNNSALDFVSGVHKQEHEYLLALYGEDAELGPDSGVYTTQGEVVAPGYEPGGRPLMGLAMGSGPDGQAWWSWVYGPAWPQVTLATRGCLIYNNSLPDKKTIFIMDFGENKTATNGPFVVNMPLPGPDTALIQVIPKRNVA